MLRGQSLLHMLLLAPPLMHTQPGTPIYVTVHDKTNHIALGLNLRYEPNKSSVVIIIDLHFLVWIDRGIIPLHKNLLCSF